MEGITHTLQSFNVFTPHLYLTYFVPQRDWCVFWCAQEIELIITRKNFNLCCA